MKPLNVRAITLFFFVVVFSPLSLSQALPVPRVVFPSTVVGNVVTFGPATADASNAAKFSFGAAANGAVFANTGTSLATAGGASVNLQVAGTIQKANAIRAVGRFAAKTIPFLNTGVALYDLANELGFTVSASTSGPPTFSTVTAGGCYYWSQSGVCGSAGTFSSGAEAAFLWGGSTAYVEIMPTASKPGRMVSPQYRDSNTLYYTQGPSVTNPATLQNFIDTANARATWPADSALGRTVSDSLKSGESASVEPVAITGPASQPISSSTVNDPVRNTSTTNTTVQNYTYGPSSVTVTNSTTSVTTDKATGALTDNGTRTDTATQPNTDKPELVSSDTALPVPPKLYKQKYPDGLAGVWKTQRDLMVATPLFTLAKGLMPSVAMSGTCPKMPVNLTFASWANYGVKDVAPPCQVWDWGKAIIIVSALLLARRLIFGG